MFAVYKMPKEQ